MINAKIQSFYFWSRNRNRTGEKDRKIKMIMRNIFTSFYIYTVMNNNPHYKRSLWNRTRVIEYCHSRINFSGFIQMISFHISKAYQLKWCVYYVLYFHYYKFIQMYCFHNPYPVQTVTKLFALEVVFLSSESSHCLHRITLTCVCLYTGLSNLLDRDGIQKTWTLQ